MVGSAFKAACGLTWRVLWCLLFMTFPVSARAQGTGGCDPDTGGTYQYLRNRYTTIATDSATGESRAQLGIPLLSANQVTFVTDSTSCRQASAAYTQAEGDNVSGRLVYLLRLGSSRYLVVDKNKYAGEWLIVWVFDSAFTPLIRLAS